jgi:quercetin dioxygenase-like cupin family protein
MQRVTQVVNIFGEMGGLAMRANVLHGNVKNVVPTKTGNLINTELYELITKESHGTDFSFNMLRILQNGSIKAQSHNDEHAIFLLSGRCEVKVGEETLRLEKNSYLYIPPNAIHAFWNMEEEPAEIVILKKC